MGEKHALVALIRHGDYHQLPDTPSAHQPFPLTEKGFRQAEACGDQIAETLHEQDWSLDTVIDSSNLLRAWQTASAISERLHGLGVATAQVEGFDELAERGLGIGGNLTVQQIADVVAQDPRAAPVPADWKSDSRYRLPLSGAESLLEAGERVARHLVDRLPSNASDRPALKLFVGHGAAFRHAAHHLGILQFDELSRLSMHHALPVVFSVDDQGWHKVHGDWKQRSGETLLD